MRTYALALLGIILGAGIILVSPQQSGNVDFVVSADGDTVIDGKAGIDTLTYGNQLTPVVASLDKQYATGRGIAEDTIINVENLIGGWAADALEGDATDNQLEGAAGDDWLWGRDGNDHLIGGLGDDVLIGGPQSDTIIYRPGDGWDQILISQDDAAGDRDEIIIETADLDAQITLTRRDSHLFIYVDSDEQIGGLIVWDAFSLPGEFGLKSIIHESENGRSTLPLDGEITGIADENAWVCGILPAYHICPSRQLEDIFEDHLPPQPFS